MEVESHVHAFLYLSVSYISVEFMLTCAIYDDFYSKKGLPDLKKSLRKQTVKAQRRLCAGWKTETAVAGKGGRTIQRRSRILAIVTNLKLGCRCYELFYIYIYIYILGWGV